MLLFPYAKDVEYLDGTLSFTLQFLGQDTETQVEVKIEPSSDLMEIMEKLIQA